MKQTWAFKGAVKNVTIVGTGGNRRQAFINAIKKDAAKVWTGRVVCGRVAVAKPTSDGLIYVVTMGSKEGYDNALLMASFYPGTLLEA